MAGWMNLNGGDFFDREVLSLNLGNNFTPTHKLSFSSFLNFNRITELPVYKSAED